MLARARIQDGQFEAFKDYEYFFQSFLLYAAETNKFIEREIDHERTRYENYRKEAIERPDWEAEDFMYVLDLKTKEGMADIYFDSLIITLYSFIEKKMLQLCRYYEPHQAFKMSDLKDNGILKYRKYLEQGARIDFSVIKEEWDKLVLFGKLRNNLVHSDGVRVIPQSDKLLINFLNAQSGMELIQVKDGYTYHIKDVQIIFEFYRCCKFFVDFLFYERVPLSGREDSSDNIADFDPELA